MAKKDRKHDEIESYRRKLEAAEKVGDTRKANEARANIDRLEHGEHAGKED